MTLVTHIRPSHVYENSRRAMKHSLEICQESDENSAGKYGEKVFSLAI